VSANIIAQILLNGLALSAIYILVALGFTLIFGIMRVVNFAHGEFAMLGGFALYFVFGTLHIPYWFAVPIAAIIVGIGTLPLERFVFRPLYQNEMGAFIGTVGLSVALADGAVVLFDVHQRAIPGAFDGIISIGDLTFPADKLAAIAIVIVVLVGFFGFVRSTRMGLSLRALAQDREVAEMNGIDTRATYRVTFFIAAALAALSGALFGQIYAVSPYMGAIPLVKAFTVVIIGGLGSIPGAALGGLLLGMSESLLNTFYGAAIAQFASFGAVMLLLIVRPWGLLGQPEK
jgi:branched-chain amino acid transport system permease protein